MIPCGLRGNAKPRLWGFAKKAVELPLSEPLVITLGSHWADFRDSSPGQLWGPFRACSSGMVEKSSGMVESKSVYIRPYPTLCRLAQPPKIGPLRTLL